MKPLASFSIDPTDTVVLFLDLQSGIVELTRTNPLDRLRKSVGALAKLAEIFAMPVFVSAIREGGQDAVMLAEIGDAIGEYAIHYRTTCDSFRNEEITTGIRATGRRTLLLSGVATELAVQLPALTAASEGYRVFVMVDACGGMSERTERAALDRIYSSGGQSLSIITLAGEIAGDLREERAQKAVGILFGIASA